MLHFCNILLRTSSFYLLYRLAKRIERNHCTIRNPQYGNWYTFEKLMTVLIKYVPPMFYFDWLVREKWHWWCALWCSKIWTIFKQKHPELSRRRLYGEGIFVLSTVSADLYRTKMLPVQKNICLVDKGLYCNYKRTRSIMCCSLITKKIIVAG